MPKFTPKVPLAQSLLVLSAIFLAAAPLLSDIFLAASVLSALFLAVLAVLSGVISLALTLARFEPQTLGFKMQEHRLWPTVTYIVVCLFVWFLSLSPGNEETLQGWIGAVICFFASLPWSYFIDVLKNIWDPLWFTHKYAAYFDGTAKLIISQLINVSIIYLTTRNKNNNHE